MQPLLPASLPVRHLSVSKFFCLRLSLPPLNLKLCHLRFVLGILLGILLDDENDTVEVVLQSLAVGTFIYISICEILMEELENGKDIKMKAFFFILGCAVICVLLTLDEGHDNHNHDNHADEHENHANDEHNEHDEHDEHEEHDDHAEGRRILSQVARELIRQALKKAQN